MGSVEAYESSAGKRYRVRYRKPDHSQGARRGFTTKRDAEIWLASVEVKKATGEFIDAADGRVTIAALAVPWLASQTHLKPSSNAVIESAWRLHVAPIWGDKAVGSIRHSDVQTWIATLSAGSENVKPKAPATVHRAYGILAAILDLAVRDRRIPSNPARGAHLPRKVTREHRYLSHTDLHRVAAASGEHEAVILLLGYTGLRWGEVSALRVRDVDLTRRRLRIAQNAVLVKGEIIVGTPKTYKRRTVPFPQLLVEHLRGALAGKSAEELVFPDKHGQHQRTPTVRYNSWWDQALEATQLPPLTIHDLRHTTASLAVSAGANVKAIQRMLGHASAAMTLDVYAELFNDDLNDVATRLDEAATIALDHAGSKRSRAGRSDD